MQDLTLSARVVQEQIDWLEERMDAMNEHLPPLRSFILPGGEVITARGKKSPTLTDADSGPPTPCGCVVRKPA